MYCYNRYILRHLIGPLLFISLSLTGIMWLAQSLRFIDLIINRGLSVGTFVYLTALLLPSLLGIVLPLALFCAAIYVYHKLLTDSELVVLESVGLSNFQLARPAIYMALVITMLGYFITLYLLPASYREFKDLQFFIRNNYASLLLEEGVFSSPVEGMTVYIRKRENSGALRGIIVHDNRDKARPSTMMAEEGLLVQTPAGPRFILEEGNRQEIDPGRGQLSLLHFDRYTLDISLYTEEGEMRWREPKERYFTELLFPTDTKRPDRLAKLRAELHNRLTWPLYSIALTLAGMAVMLSGSFNRRGIWRRIVGATLVALLLMALGIALPNMITKQPNLVPLIYGALLGICLLAAWFLRKRRYKAIPRSLPSYMHAGDAS